mmetsp:Transcript_49050/g.118816  ORF Transcript_49050/g.118816 Transcript_49050/m.118816 type:complete len:961 (-) Transcript_49050:91-2973(-)
MSSLSSVRLTSVGTLFLILLLLSPAESSSSSSNLRRRNQESNQEQRQEQKQKSRVLSPSGPCALKYIEAQWPNEIIELSPDAESSDSASSNNNTFVIDTSIQFSSSEQLDVKNWRCEVDEDTAMAAGGQFVFEIDGLDQSFFNDPTVVPGDTFLQGGLIVDDKYVVSAEAVEVSYGAGFSDPETRRHERRLARTTGTKSVLVVRVIGGQSQTSASEGDLREETFGENDVNLRTQYDGCSGGKLQMVPYNGLVNGGSGSSTRPFINNGVVTLNVPGITSGQNMFNAENLVRNEIVDKLGSLDQFDHIMMCLPPGTKGPIGYAYLNDRVSVFNEYTRGNNGKTIPWCSSVSIQMHEIGHNLDLFHSGSGGDQYADTSGVMGYSTSNDDAPKSCFNALKEFQLGWFSGRDPRLSNIQGTKKARTQLIPSASYKKYEDDASKDVILRIPVPGSEDLYISYNRAVGANSGTPQAADKLVVITGLTRATSYKVGELGPGQQLQLNNYGGGSTPLKVRFTRAESNSGVANEIAIVDVFFNAADCDPTNCGGPPLTPNPTPAPIPQPTPVPTVAQTLSPVDQQVTGPPTDFLVLLDSSFENDAAGLRWKFDVVRNGGPWLKNSNAFRYTLGQRKGGKLTLSVGGGDDSPVFGMSSGWVFDFKVPFDAEIEVSFDWTHTMSDSYEPDENSDLLVLFDDQDKCQRASGCGPDISRLNGGGSRNSRSTKIFSASANTDHSITFALWNDLKTQATEISTATIDNVQIIARSADVNQDPTTPNPTPLPTPFPTKKPNPSPTPVPTQAPAPITILDASFDSGSEGLVYVDDAFKGTNEPLYAQGEVEEGQLEIVLGGIDPLVVMGMSGGWSYTFTLPSTSNVDLSFDWTFAQTTLFEINEEGELLFSLDGGAAEQVSKVAGGGSDSGVLSKQFTAVSAGTHTIVLGAYSDKKSAASEITTATFDNVKIVATPTP